MDQMREEEQELDQMRDDEHVLENRLNRIRLKIMAMRYSLKVNTRLCMM